MTLPVCCSLFVSVSLFLSVSFSVPLCLGLSVSLSLLYTLPFLLSPPPALNGEMELFPQGIHHPPAYVEALSRGPMTGCREMSLLLILALILSYLLKIT